MSWILHVTTQKKWVSKAQKYGFEFDSEDKIIIIIMSTSMTFYENILMTLM